VEDLVADPSGQHLLLRGSLDIAALFELYSVDLDDLSLVQLSHEQPLDSDVVEARFAPGGEVVYRTRTSLGRSALFTVPADASSSPMQLNEPVPTGNVAGDVSAFRVTRDGRKLVYRADQVTDEHHDLYAVDAMTPGLPVLLTGNAGSVDPQFSLLEPPGLVLFQTQDAAGFKLQVTDLKGSPATELDVAPARFQDLATAHGGRRLVYRKARAAGTTTDELWSVLLDGSSSPVPLHGPLPSTGGVLAFRVAPDGTVVFISDLQMDNFNELFAVPAKGGTPRRISGSMIANGDVDAFEVGPTGKYVAFTADAAVDGKLELFTVPLDGSQPPGRRSGLMPVLGDVSRFVFAGDGWHLVYLADQLNDQHRDLFSTPIQGASGTTGGLRRTSPGTTLLSRHAGVRDVQPDFALAAGGTTVLYRAGVGTGGIELFRVPVDGSARPMSLSGPLAGGRNVVAAALAADQGHVVYLADQLVDERFELFSVLFTGGAPVPLASPPGSGDVVDFEITPDSRHVVFRADLDADEIFELYRVPVDGSAPAVRVNGPMVPDGDVNPDFVALDGRVLYAADQERDEVTELFLTR
jgi:dipeptidyl aminopeptidase/acylaminoacyl peptidase